MSAKDLEASGSFYAQVGFEQVAGEVEIAAEADDTATGPASFVFVDPHGNPIPIDLHAPFAAPCQVIRCGRASVRAGMAAPMLMPVTSLYAGLLGILFVALSTRTLRLRRRLRVAIGDGGQESLLRASRVHANFAEYVPLCLLLIFMLERDGALPLLLHGLGVALLAGRIVHALAVSRIDEPRGGRVVAMSLTLTSIASASALLLYRCVAVVAG